MNWIIIVIEFLKELIKPLSVAVGSFLLYRQGKEAGEKKAAEEHVKDAKKAQSLNDHLRSLPDDDIDHILSNKPRAKSTTSSKK